jgi:uncharacterized protein involved in exopolysaccharide biosynthesis
VLTSLSIRNAAHLTFRRGKIFLIAMLLPPVITAAVVLTQQSQYESNASVMVKIIDQEVASPDLVNQQQSQNASSSAAMAAQIIASELLIMTSNDVYKAALTHVGVDKVYPDIERQAAKAGVPLMDYAAEKLEKDFTVKTSGDTNVLMLSAFNTNPDVAQTLLKSIISSTVEKQVSVLRDPRTEFLGRKLVTLQKEADTAKQALAAFKRRTQITSFDEERTLLLRQRDDIQSRLSQTRAQLVSAQGRGSTLQESLEKTPAQIALSDENDRSQRVFEQAQARLSTARAQYDNAQRRFTADNPELLDMAQEVKAAERALELANQQSGSRVRKGINPLAQTISTTLSTARSDANAARGEVKERERQLEDIGKRLAFLDASEIELRDLERKQSMADASYKSYLQRAESARIVSDMNDAGISGLSIVQQPTLPYKPSRPKKPLLMGIAIFGGILAAFGLCLLLETLDTTISLPEHAEAVLGLPVLASIQMKKTGG